MGRNKLEDRLKEQLQGHEIKPSDEAWDRISEQLEVSETSRSKRFQWYGIAAGFIGILFVSALYFTMKEPSAVPETEITDVTNDSIPFNKTPAIIQEEKLPDDDVIVDTKAQEERIFDENATADTEVQNKKSIQTTSVVNKDTPIKDALASSVDEERRVDKVAVPSNTSEELIDDKIAEIVAQVEMLEKEDSTVTDAEIDSLLRGAQQEILEDKIFRKDRSVDAVALLADVEDELDRSFRDQIFDALKDGFLKVRTAVADRDR